MTNNETPAYVCSHVFNRTRPVLLVSRDDGDWQLLCGEPHEAEERPRVVGLNHLVANDPTLNVILNLPPDWEAERASQSEQWVQRRIPAP